MKLFCHNKILIKRFSPGNLIFKCLCLKACSTTHPAIRPSSLTTRGGHVFSLASHIRPLVPLPPPPPDSLTPHVGFYHSPGFTLPLYISSFCNSI